MEFEVIMDALSPAKLASFWSQALQGYSVRPYDEAEIHRLACLGTPQKQIQVSRLMAKGLPSGFKKVIPRPPKEIEFTWISKSATVPLKFSDLFLLAQL